MPVDPVIVVTVVGWVAVPIISKVVQSMMDTEESKPPSIGIDQTRAQIQRSPGPETHIISPSQPSSSISIQRTQHKPSNSKNNPIKPPSSSGSSRTTQKQPISSFQAHINDEIQKLASSYYDINKSTRRIKDGEREKHVALSSSSGNHERVEQKKEKKGETNKRRRSEWERMTSSNPHGSMLPKVNGKA